MLQTNVSGGGQKLTYTWTFHVLFRGSACGSQVPRERAWRPKNGTRGGGADCAHEAQAHDDWLTDEDAATANFAGGESS